MSSLIYHTSQDSTGSCLYDLQDTALRYLQVRVHLLGSCGLPLYNSTCSRVQAPFFGQQHISPRVFHSLMAPPTPGDFERCSELRQWYKNHSGECPRRKSDANTETTLAQWLDKARSRRARAHNNWPSGRKLTASETAHLNNIIATQRPKMSPKDHFERCNELRQWCMNHSGERPRRRSDDKTEAALARWLDRALVRRARACDNRPSGRQLTATETEHLNSILARPQLGQVAATASATSSGATATELNAAPERAEPPAPFARKRLRQKSSASNRFSTAELVPDVTSSHQMVQRMKRSGHAQFCF